MKKKIEIKSIGNDIVDLKDPDSKISSYNSRFLQRVLSEQEQKYFSVTHGTPRMHSLYIVDKKSEDYFWSLWSLKEAAYKAVKRIRPEIIFSPRQFIVSADLGKIQYQDIDLIGKVKKNKNYIHSLAYLVDLEKSTDLKFKIRWFIGNFGLKKENLSKQSYLVRFHFQKKIANYFPGKTNNILIKEKKNIPYLQVNQRTYPVSYSHHGRFIASSVLIN